MNYKPMFHHVHDREKRLIYNDVRDLIALIEKITGKMLMDGFYECNAKNGFLRKWIKEDK